MRPVAVFCFVAVLLKCTSAQQPGRTEIKMAEHDLPTSIPIAIDRNQKTVRCPPLFQKLGKDCVRVVTAAATPQCAPGSELSPDNLCTTFTGKIASCPAEFSRLGSRCEHRVTATPTQFCASGFTLTEDNQCTQPVVNPPVEQCPAGSVRKGDLCLFEEEQPPELACPPGYTLAGKKCVIEELYNCTPERLDNPSPSPTQFPTLRPLPGIPVLTPPPTGPQLPPPTGPQLPPPSAPFSLQPQMIGLQPPLPPQQIGVQPPRPPQQIGVQPPRPPQQIGVQPPRPPPIAPLSTQPQMVVPPVSPTEIIVTTRPPISTLPPEINPTPPPEINPIPPPISTPPPEIIPTPPPEINPTPPPISTLPPEINPTPPPEIYPTPPRPTRFPALPPDVNPTVGPTTTTTPCPTTTTPCPTTTTPCPTTTTPCPTTPSACPTPTTPRPTPTQPATTPEPTEPATTPEPTEPATTTEPPLEISGPTTTVIPQPLSAPSPPPPSMSYAMEQPPTAVVPSSPMFFPQFPPLGSYPEGIPSFPFVPVFQQPYWGQVRHGEQVYYVPPSLRGNNNWRRVQAQSKESGIGQIDYVLQAVCKRVRTIPAERICTTGVLNGKMCRVEVEVPPISVPSISPDAIVVPPQLKCPDNRFTLVSRTICQLSELTNLVYVCPDSTQDIGDRCATSSSPLMTCPPDFTLEEDRNCLQTLREPPIVEYNVRYSCTGTNCDNVV